jgi:hypothetical protein
MTSLVVSKTRTALSQDLLLALLNAGNELNVTQL